MLRQRVLVAATLIPLALAVLWVGGWVFLFVGLLLLLLAGHEYLGLWQRQGLRPASWLTLAGMAALAGALYLFGPAWPAWLALTSSGLALLAYHVVRYERHGGPEATAFSVALAGVVYIGGMGGFLLALRALPYGWFWTLLALLTVWAADSAAYFVGMAWGRHRMAPRLSPKKSWEGFFGGLAGGLLAGVVWSALARSQGWLPPGFSLAWGAGVGLSLALLTPLGDLGQSLMKRQAGVKDSGRLLPGHGGVFDRIDSWLWAGPLVYWFARWFLGMG